MKTLFHKRLLVRNLYAQTLLENFLISAVSTILLIRFYLEITGYPQIGGSHLHIAHMLYGGLLMLATIFILFTFLNRLAYNMAAITGGIGFGFFIDELGKFITKDNNYFFQPTVALIYVIFVVLYLIGELLPKYKSVTKTEYLVNAIELVKEIIIQDLDSNEKKQALAYLKASDQSNPLVLEMKKILQSSRSKPNTSDMYTRIKLLVFTKVSIITQSRIFFYFVIFFIVSQATLSLLFTFIVISALNKFIYIVVGVVLGFVTLYFQRNNTFLLRFLTIVGLIGIMIGIHMITKENISISLSFIGWGTLLSTSLAALFSFLGLNEIPKSHFSALKYFRLSVLVSIFLTQFFLFYELQFYALIGLLLNILMLLTLEYVIARKITEDQLVGK